VSDPIKPRHLPNDEILADRLGLSTKEFKRYRLQNLVSVSTADAVGSDGFVVTCQLGNRVWEGVILDGTVISEEVRFLRGKRAGNPPPMVRRGS